MIVKAFFPFLLFATFHLGFSLITKCFLHQNPLLNHVSYRSKTLLVNDESGVLYASRMPVFDADDEEQLRKIMAGEFWEDDMPDFSDNLPTRERTKAKTTAPTTAAPVNPNSVSAKNILAPNANWRTATNSPAPPPQNPLLIAKAPTLIKKKKPVVSPSADYLDFSDLDYDDFESAMRYCMRNKCVCYLVQANVGLLPIFRRLIYFMSTHFKI